MGMLFQYTIAYMKRDFTETLNALCRADPSLMKSNGAVNSAALARATKINQATAYRMLRGEFDRPRPENERKLKRFFRVTSDQLYGAEPIPRIDDVGVSDRKMSYSVAPEAESNVTQIDRPINWTPLISWITAGEYCESPDNFEPGDAEDWKPSPFKQGPLSFCLRVSGPSMWPDYPDGCLIFVDPEKEATHGKDVVVRTSEGKHNFKRLQITQEGTYLMALNPDWQERIIKIPEGSAICGVVVGMLMEK